MKKQSGFTLIEVVVIIAVIGILAGIGIPRFQQAQAEALGAKVIANLRAMDSAINLYMTKTGQVPTNIAQITTNDSTAVPPCYHLIEALGNSNGRDFLIKHNDGTEQIYNVPTTGAYSVSKGRATFGGTLRTVDWYLGLTSDMGSSMQAIIEAISAINVNNLNSEATKIAGSHAQALVAVLDEMGIDLAAMGAQSWSYSASSGGNLIWTSGDIATMQPGEKVAVIQYKKSSGNYTVWTGVVETRTDVVNNNPTPSTYNVIRAVTGYKPSTGSAANGNQTYEKALEYYEALKASL